MKTVIHLDSTVFDPKTLGSVGEGPTTCVWNNKGEFVKVPDFGTVFIGLEKVTSPEFKEELEACAVGEGPIFAAPEDWTWAQIAKTFGLFPSTSQARKNGWTGEPEQGFSSKIVRINKVKGELLVVRITDDSPWAQ